MFGGDHGGGEGYYQGVDRSKPTNCSHTCLTSWLTRTVSNSSAAAISILARR